jgi:DNA-binding cell septation regulator SpoVG
MKALLNSGNVISHGEMVNEHSAELDEISELSDGWDGFPDSEAPSADVVANARIMLSAWPQDERLKITYVEPGIYGDITLTCIDKDGFVIATVDVVPGDKAVFIAMDRTAVRYSSSAFVSDTEAVQKAFVDMISALWPTDDMG